MNPKKIFVGCDSVSFGIGNFQTLGTPYYENFVDLGYPRRCSADQMFLGLMSIDKHSVVFRNFSQCLSGSISFIVLVNLIHLRLELV